MLNFVNGENENQYIWGMISDITDARKNLGMEMPVSMYRLFQYSIREEMVKQFGKEATIAVFRKAGITAGKEFANNMLTLDLEISDFITHLQDTLVNTKIGILRVEEFDFDTGEAILTVSEDLDCSGLPITGETVCNYGEGFLAGILQVYTKKEYIVTEIDCWATGSRVCRFKAHKKE